MDTEIMLVVKDYGGLVVGLVLLLLAVSVLPGRAKWYVLTAGLAVLGYEAYMRTVNRRMLKEADAERNRLRGELAQLDGQRLALERRVSELNAQLVELNSRLIALTRQKEALQGEGEALAAQKQQLDRDSEQLLARSRETIEQIGGIEELLAQLTQAQHAVDQMERLSH